LFEGIADVGAVCLVHCEDESITQHAEAALREARRTDPRVVLEWRRREAELAAVSLVGLLARLTSARVVAAHVSHEQAIQLLLRERAPSLYVESCPQYFTLLESEILEHGPLRKFTPPARARDEQELAAMWAAVRRGEVSYISSDHAPSTREQKSAGSIWDVPFGIPGVETTLPLLLDGAHRGEISYEQIVAAYAENPARLYGLYPRKGTIGPESDADLVVVDPRREWVIRNEDIVSRAGWSPYDGRRVTGMPVQTYLRGRLIARDRSVVGEAGCGRFITPRTVTTSDDA
jgi:dihydroorotase